MLASLLPNCIHALITIGYNMFYSQAKQDEWVADKFGYKRNGFFLDVGAFDGVHISNTVFFERHLDWNGICIEGNPWVYQNLCQNRNSLNINVAVTDYNGTCFFGSDSIVDNGTEVQCKTLNTILEENNAPLYIDYLSIDIEGNEYEALKNFDFKKWTIGIITIEHNLYMNGPDLKNSLYDLLSKNGFIRVVEDAIVTDPGAGDAYLKPFEDWYVNEKIIGDLKI